MDAVQRPSPKDSELVSLLLRSAADVNATRSQDDETALHLATFWNKNDVVQMLVRAGANVNAQNSDGETPFDIAVDEGHHKLAQTLRELGGSRNRT